MEKEINRIKAVLAEVGKTNLVAGGTAWCQPDDRVEMVYKHLPARLAYLIPNSELLNVSRRELLRP